MNTKKTKLTLDQIATYQIKVPGHLDEGWLDDVTISVKKGEDGTFVSVLTGSFDQAGLQGMLRRLYSIGLPLISVEWIKPN